MAQGLLRNPTRVILLFVLLLQGICLVWIYKISTEFESENTVPSTREIRPQNNINRYLGLDAPFVKPKVNQHAEDEKGEWRKEKYDKNNKRHVENQRVLEQFAGKDEEEEEEEYLFPIPPGVTEDHKWRYKSTGLYWHRHDVLYRKFVHFNRTLTLPPPVIEQEVTRVCNRLKDKLNDNAQANKLCRMFSKCYPNTLSTTTQLLHDGTSYVITGDIPLMWLRDSSAQVNQYLSLSASDPHLQIIIEGMIRRQLLWIIMDPYGSSFRLVLDFDNAGKKALTEWDYKSGRTIHVAMHNYELDSLCYFVKLSYDYWQETGIYQIFDVKWMQAAKAIIRTLRIEQHHHNSSYTYPELPNNGRGNPVCYTGMSWVGFRPSDDQCTYHYLVPSNMFAVVSLRRMAEIFEIFYGPEGSRMKEEALALADEIDRAIHQHAVVELKTGKVYAYEVDGCGNHNLMDDANVPSLLSIPYLHYSSPYDPDGKIAENTRKFILSSSNPYFFSGSAASGIGSPHTPRSMVWPIALTMQALTSTDPNEVKDLVYTLSHTDADTDMMHESFSVSNPHSFTRHWFAWANSLFSEMLISTYLPLLENS